MTTARGEAERKFPLRLQGDNESKLKQMSELGRERKAFIAGAEWQAEQPVEITSEMVGRAIQEYLRPHRDALGNIDLQLAMKAALETALGGSGE